ncbi:hypothetical protein ZTR_04589 [Talaromyces verruculosus]|nr:hypothetical protein ZTR_04589 [Talaromyces verruculosus]
MPEIGSVQVIQRRLKAPEIDPTYTGLHETTTVLPAGFHKSPEHAAFQVETVFHQDVPIDLRDGVKIRTDIFRPADSNAKPVPALVAWSPYGKSGRGFFNLDLVPGRVGVAKSRLSGYEKFEAPDPAEWTARGYAIVNPDVRGAYDSEGNIRWWCSDEGRDGYDVTEALAAMPWCNGSVAFVGNSWLAIAQWFIAAQRPPHLKCIAAFEGAKQGRASQEDLVAMIEKYPLLNEYWADKRARIDRITCPVYALASYSTGLHTFGSFRGFTDVPHERKWIRVHTTQEWHDLYQKATNDDLQRFLDCYTKNISNSWEQTPRVRASLLGYNKARITQEPVDGTNFTCLPIKACWKSPPSEKGTVSYAADTPSMQMDADNQELRFTFTFSEPTHLLGCSRAELYMSCADHDDMDVWVQLRKADRTGCLLQSLNIPVKDLGSQEHEVERINPLYYLGPSGALRASHRAVDDMCSRENFPEHEYARQEKVKPGMIVKLDIGLWQTGMVFDAGEKLVFKISGHCMTLAEFPQLRGAELQANRGTHIVHMGGSYKSHISIPLVTL